MATTDRPPSGAVAGCLAPLTLFALILCKLLFVIPLIFLQLCVAALLAPGVVVMLLLRRPDTSWTWMWVGAVGVTLVYWLVVAICVSFDKDKWSSAIFIGFLCVLYLIPFTLPYYWLTDQAGQNWCRTFIHTYVSWAEFDHYAKGWWGYPFTDIEHDP
jgi:hypothetical protein